MTKIKQWDIYEVSYTYRGEENPYTDVELFGIFRMNQISRKVRGFYAGDNTFKIRFAPDIQGEWRLETSSNISELIGMTAEFTCTAGSNKGPVKVANQYYFAYENGTNFYPFGTTCYAWHYQSQELQAKTLEALKKSPFNKIRMLLFPTNNENKVSEEQPFPFKKQRNAAGKLEIDFEQFDLSFFESLEAQLKALEAIDVQADLILFHPYEDWGFNSMTKEQDLRYVRYVVARLASFSNVWWSLANEFDLVEEKSGEWWDTLGKCIAQEDPAAHLLSIHNWHNVPLYYDNTSNWYPHQKPWITHLSLQYDRMFQIPKWRHEYGKPVVNDECRYEGNISEPWGNLSPKAMVKQFWEGVCNGGYATHGETYADEEGYNWVSHGGTLLGESASRIAFLRNIIEENDLQLQPFAYRVAWDCSKGMAENGKLLIYLGADTHSAEKKFTYLEEGKQYSVQIIDTWDMTIQSFPEVIDKHGSLPLPERNGLAVLLTPIN